MRAVIPFALACACASAACTVPGDNPGDAGGGSGIDSGNPGADAGPLGASKNVSIIVEPNGHSGDELVTAINGAKTSVYMTMYQIDDDDVIGALVSRAKAGLDVQAILDTANMSWNTDAFDKLNTAGVKVVWSSSTFTFTHEKTVILDGTTAWIMTMNANNSSPGTNREYLAIDGDAGDVAEATAVFKADHAHTAITPSGVLVVADANARGKLVQLIASATHDLDIEGEELSDTNQSGVILALEAAVHRGVTVRAVVANGGGPPTQAQALTSLKAAGASVVISGSTSGNGSATKPYIHAKAIVVDCGTGTCTSGFVGSENFSAGSLGYNRELGVIFEDPSELAKIEAAITTDFAAGHAP